LSTQPLPNRPISLDDSSCAREPASLPKRDDLAQQLISERQEHEDALLHKWRLIAELQEEVRNEAERRRQIELTLEQRDATISELSHERSNLTDALTRQEETLARRTRFAARLSERLRRESELRRQAQSERDLAVVRASGPVTRRTQGFKSRWLRSRWRQTARSLSKLPPTAKSVGMRPQAGTHALAMLRAFLAQPKKLREAHQVVISGLFDEVYYLRNNPDVASSRMSPLAHYILTSGHEGRNPHPLFDTDYYLQCNPDVAASGVNPLAHYAASGAFEGRRPHPLFDPAYYLETNPDVRNARIEPLRHFMSSGGAEGRNPNPFFDSAYYLRTNPDVAGSESNPLVHFNQRGWSEGRCPSPHFDTAYYLSHNEDVSTSGANPLTHYIEFGHGEGRAAVDPALNPDSALDSRDFPEVRMRATPLTDARPDTPTILCLSHVMPWPPRAGNEYRIYRMLRWFRDQGYRIVVVIAPLPGEGVAAEAVRVLSEEFSNVVLCDRDGRLEYVLRDVPDHLSSLSGQPAETVGALLGENFISDRRERGLLNLDRMFCHDPLITTVLRLQSALGRHVFLAEYIWMSRIMPLVPEGVLKIIDTIDVFSTKREKVLQYGIDDLDIAPEEEARRLQDADLVLAIQEDERRELQRLLPGKPVITAGVDFDVVDDGGIPSGRSVLCVASDNPLNKKGLKDFLRFAWPHVRRDVPEAELIVVGSISRSAPANVPGVTPLGHVADLAALYARVRLVINPAVAGTGIKIKTLEALSHLRPIVTWPNGAEGLPPELAALCVIVNDWYEFGQKVADALAPEAPRLFSTRERETVIRLTSPAVAYGALGDVVAQFLSAHEPH
jgi:hypothetical protein